MRDTIFMRDGDGLLTYGRLLDFANGRASKGEFLKENSLFIFLKRFFAALATGNNVDISDGTISVSGTGQRTFENIDDFLSAIKMSQSRITLATSGTSGQPKKVSHTVQSLSRQTRVSAEYANHVWGFAYSPCHMAGLQVIFQVLFNKNSAANLFMKPKTCIFDSIEKFGITHISGTPTFYRLLLPEDKGHPSVIRITLGGEKSDPQLHKALLQIFPNAKINNIYASTEGGSLLSSSGSVFMIPSEMASLIKIEGGELLIHKILLGESESLTLENGFYRSGDIVEWTDDKKTSFKFVGRKNSLVNVGGYKVNTEEIEDAIKKIPQIENAIVYGRKNSVLGKVLCADIILKSETSIEASSVREFLAKEFPSFKIPRKIQFVEKLANTASGKIKRQ